RGDVNDGDTVKIRIVNDRLTLEIIPADAVTTTSSFPSVAGTNGPVIR
mgnify:CR=1